MKRLSIVIINYNSSTFLLGCLRRLTSQQPFPSSWEMIIVDNGSHERLESKRIRQYIPTVKIICNQVNRGFAKANNQAIVSATGQYVLTLNPDTLVDHHTLSHLLDFMDKTTDAGAVTCKLLLPDNTLDDACHRGFPTPLRAFFHFTFLAGLFPQSSVINGYHLGYQDMDTIHRIEAVSGAFMLIRKKAGDSLNWFDEDYFWYGEDLDFCYRLVRAEWNIYYHPFVSAIHFKGISSGIKKHTAHLSSADQSTRDQALTARFSVMKIFFEKHLKQNYHPIVRTLVYWGIDTIAFIYRILL